MNTTVFEGSFDPTSPAVVEIAATDLAVDLGNIMTASMVMLGAYVAATGMRRASTRSTPRWPSRCRRTARSTWR